MGIISIDNELDPRVKPEDDRLGEVTGYRKRAKIKALFYERQDCV